MLYIVVFDIPSFRIIYGPLYTEAFLLGLNKNLHFHTIASFRWFLLSRIF